MIRPVIPVFLASQNISVVTQFALSLSLTAYLVVFIVILTMHQEAQPESFILASGQGNSGWSKGTAWMLAITNALYAFGGTDGGLSGSQAPEVANTSSYSYL